MPYCIKKCKYCDFVSYTDRLSTSDKYADAVISELLQYDLSEYAVKTVFFGGGTPTSVKPELIAYILSAIKKNCMLLSDAEITLEANPSTLDTEKLQKYRACGINRLSMGVQSFDDGVLETLGRVHDSKTAVCAFELTRSAGFDNISLDLMFAIPGQTEQMLMDSLDECIRLAPEHISLYSLILEEGTMLTKQVQSGLLTATDDETDRRMYRNAVETLEKHGYMQYEVSNFAKKGYESRHNICYWERSEYIGLGCAAHSFFKGVRYSNTEVLDEYLSGIDVRCNMSVGEVPDNIGAAEEIVMLGLRMNKGFDVNELKCSTGIDIFKLCGKKLDMLFNEGICRFADNRISVTDKGRDVLNTVILNLTENFR